MIKNYLKIAWRNLIRSKSHSFINVAGLSIGMAVAILIGLWIWDELSFNKYHQNYDHITRVMQRQTINGEVSTLKAMPIPAAYQLRQTYRGNFKYVVLSSWTNTHLASYQGKSLSVTGNFMEPEAPDMLTLKMIKGTRSGLKDPSSILLSETVAQAIFGNADPIDKVIKLDSLNLKVTGVYQALPANTSFNEVSFVAPWKAYARTEEVRQAEGNWNHNSFQIFAQIADNANPVSLSSKIKDIKFDQEDNDGKRLKPELLLDPMSRWHLYSEFKDGANIGGNIKYVWLFGIIGIFVLLLACINFMNLSTARSEKRAKEVGIRKAVGSVRSQLIMQFLSESLLMALLAFILSLLLIQFSLPFFNELSGKQMYVLWKEPVFWILGTSFAIFSGLLAGIYPAFYLSSFNPVKVLKGTFRIGKMASLPRKTLIVIQFTFSVLMIIGTIVVFRQIQYAKNRPIGYNRTNLVMIRPYSEDIHNHFESFRNDLIQSGVITEIAESGNQITRGSRTSGGLAWQGKDQNMADEFATFAVTSQYGKAVNWQLKDGKDFSQSLASDQFGLILNETAVKYMRLKNPVGQIISWNDKKYTVLGVTKDMIVESPYEPIKPTIFYISTEPGIINVKINPKTSAVQALNTMEAIYKKYALGQPFDFQFVDQEYAKKFGNEERIGKLASSFAALAIFISCLGLFGMASFMAEQRTKEIGVRKVLGATVFNLWSLLTKDFISMIIISIMIASPVAYYFMHNWLQSYSFHARMDWSIFVVTAAGALTITLLTTSIQSVKAALANPTKSLKAD